jgi:hypothetical protein
MDLWLALEWWGRQERRRRGRRVGTKGRDFIGCGHWCQTKLPPGPCTQNTQTILFVLLPALCDGHGSKWNQPNSIATSIGTSIHNRQSTNLSSISNVKAGLYRAISSEKPFLLFFFLISHSTSFSLFCAN